MTNFVVIGAPGHGKSTVLNEFADDDIFNVASSGQSCTQAGGEWEEKNVKDIVIDDGRQKHTLRLNDTPGFPDPDQKKAAQYYDYVVGKCNKPINGVLFVMKPEREVADVLEKYAALLREFVHLRVPLVMLMNGTEPPQRPREKPDAYEKRRAAGIKDFYNIGRTIERVTGLHARNILVSYCIADLPDLGKDVARIFCSAPAQSSRVRTYADVVAELKKCSDSSYAAKKKIADEEARIAKCRDDITSLEEEASSLRAWAKGTCWIPFAGLIAAPVLLTKAAAKLERVSELSLEIGDAERAKRAAGDVKKLEALVADAEAKCKSMSRYLKG